MPTRFKFPERKKQRQKKALEMRQADLARGSVSTSSRSKKSPSDWVKMVEREIARLRELVK